MKPPRLRILAVLSILIAQSCLHGSDRLVLGGNFNEHSEMIRFELLRESKTRAIRGFIPASPFIRGQRQLATDPAVQNLKRAVNEGYEVILCLKWDFKARNWRVPQPDSVVEKQCFQWVDALLDEVGQDVVILEMINEIMVDTQEPDLLPGQDGSIPMVEFQKRLVDHLFAQGTPPPVYMGGFTRLYDDKVREHPVTNVLMNWIQDDKRISGASFHVHTREMEGFEQSLRYIRGYIPEKPMIVTEFSLVWKYKLAMKFPLGRFDKGKQFAKQYGCDPEMPVREYINSAIDNPVQQDVWMEFLHSQYWYMPGFLDQACAIMDAHGVTYATYAFQQGSSGMGKLREGTNPWILNPLYLPNTTRGVDGKTAVNTDFMGAYSKWR